MATAWLDDIFEHWAHERESIRQEARVKAKPPGQGKCEYCRTVLVKGVCPNLAGSGVRYFDQMRKFCGRAVC